MTDKIRVNSTENQLQSFSNNRVQRCLSPWFSMKMTKRAIVMMIMNDNDDTGDDFDE